MSFFTANSITAGYGGQPVIRDICFQIKSGCILGILGANGSGKTTLLKALCGILPHEGSCSLDGVLLEQLSVRQLARVCSYIPQRSGITIDISVLDVVLMGFNPLLGLLERPTSAMIRDAVAALDRVGLCGKEDTNFLHLSEGQKQLCILARTLVCDSRLLLLDEPESALDFRFRHTAFSLVRQWVAEKERCALITLHDPALALNRCDKLLLLHRGRPLCLLDPSTDSLERMEQMLGAVYGAVSLQRCQDRKGNSQLVMLREDEE